MLSRFALISRFRMWSFVITQCRYFAWRSCRIIGARKASICQAIVQFLALVTLCCSHNFIDTMLLPKFPKVDIDPALAARMLASAHNAADAASVPTMANFRQALAVENKEQPGSFDPVTIADRSAEKQIKEVLLEAFPQHGFFGEESEKKITTDQPLWIVDPIDGTRAYITGSPLWGTLISVYDGEDVVLGMLEQPVLQERFVGTAFGNGAVAATAELIRPEGRIDLRTRQGIALGDAIIQTTAPEFFNAPEHNEAFKRVAAAVSMVRYGGDCYCYALLAMGFVDIVIEATLQPYDIAALIPIVEGAGGVVTTWDGEPAVNGGSVIACANPQLHAQVLAMVK